MKYLIIALFITTGVSAQDSEYLKLWNKYYDESSAIVTDSVTESGVITYHILTDSGELKLAPKDTVWNEVDCPKYKERSSVVGIRWDGVYLNGITTTSSNYVYSPTNFTAKISRTKVCECQLREPTQDDFWEWLKENGYRK